MKRRTFIKLSTATTAATLLQGNSFANAFNAANPDDRVLVIGATAFACGMALANPGRVFIVERGIHTAPEYTLSYSPIEAGTPTLKLSRQIYQGATDSGILADKKLHHPPLSDYLTTFLAQRKLNVLMHAEVIGYRTLAGRSEITLHATDGRTTLDASRIIDTTPLGWQNSGLPYLRSKALSATLRGELAEDKIKAISNTTILKGIFPDEWLFRVEMPTDIDWHKARLILQTKWQEQQTSLPDFKLLAEAGEFSYHYNSNERICQRNNLGNWIPGAQFSNLLAAIEEGLKWNLE